MSLKRERGLAPRSLFYLPSLLSSWDENLEERLRQFMECGPERRADWSLSEDEHNIYVDADLPGVRSSDIRITMHQNTLWIKAEREEEQENQERKMHTFSRRAFSYHIELPSQVEEGSEQAHFQDGVLRVTFKKTRENQVRTIALAESRNSNKNQK